MKKSAMTASISLPEGFDSAIEGNKITIKGPKGELMRKIPAKELSVSKENNAVVVKAKSPKKKTRSAMKSFAKHLSNMVEGIEKGYYYRLAVVYSHFPINIAAKGGNVEINNFLGEKHPRIARIMPGAEVQIKGKEIFVKGTDKEAVGQTAINLEKATRVTGRDRRIYQDGIFLVEKNTGEAK